MHQLIGFAIALAITTFWATRFVKGEQDWVLSASPALEIGTEVQGENGTILRPFVRAGATVFDDNNFVGLPRRSDRRCTVHGHLKL
jgi:hypothetical protein